MEKKIDKLEKRIVALEEKVQEQPPSKKSLVI